MTVLPVTAPLGHLAPAIMFEHLDELSELHRPGRYLSGARLRLGRRLSDVTGQPPAPWPGTGSEPANANSHDVEVRIRATAARHVADPRLRGTEGMERESDVDLDRGLGCLSAFK